MRLLIIGTLEGQIGAAAQIAVRQGAKVIQSDDVEAGLAAIRAAKGADLVMVDVRLDVAQLIGSLNSERIGVPVIACGIGNDTQAAVAAIKAGAKEYVPLPPDPELIGAVLAAVSHESSAIVSRDPWMRAVLEMANQIAPSDASVLVVGGSGTGKELMARHVHAKSRRASGPFVAVNCAAIPETLLETELFGHEKGAFTGAVARRIGRFEEATGGTLLLDEISEMDPRLQAKLLRAIQEKEIDRVGGSKPVKVDTRIIATSNRNLEDEVACGRFREDLFYRLNVVSLRLPDLRERPQDIELLARHFAAKYAEANVVEARSLSSAALDRLVAHAWPGNVRELENTMHRAVLLATGEEIGPEAIHLTGSSATASHGRTDVLDDSGTQGLVGRTVADVERDLIIDTLAHCFGNRTHAANILGISIRTLRNKLRQYTAEGIPVPMPGDSERTVA